MKLNVPFHLSNAEYKYLFVSGDTDKKDDRDRYAETRPALQSGDLDLEKFIWQFQPVSGASEYVYLRNQAHG
jgi:hypothetical protein